MTALMGCVFDIGHAWLRQLGVVVGGCAIGRAGGRVFGFHRMHVAWELTPVLVAALVFFAVVPAWGAYAGFLKDTCSHRCSACMRCCLSSCDARPPRGGS
ncbi:MAG: hypothetical protein ACLT98_10760 [Eggerthellaceae bacterium]